MCQNICFWASIQEHQANWLVNVWCFWHVPHYRQQRASVSELLNLLNMSTRNATCLIKIYKDELLMNCHCLYKLVKHWSINTVVTFFDLENLDTFYGPEKPIDWMHTVGPLTLRAVCPCRRVLACPPRSDDMLSSWRQQKGIKLRLLDFLLPLKGN